MTATLGADDVTAGFVTGAELLAQGLSDDQIRGLVAGGRLRRVHPGVFQVPDGSRRPFDQLAAVCLVAPTATVSHRSATLAYGVPLARAWSRPEVTRDDRHCHLANVLTHRYSLSEQDITSMGGLRITTLARTLVDVARVVPFAEALVPMDFALRQELVTRQECAAVLARLPGINFRWRVKDMIELADPLSGSVLESFSRGQLICHGVPRPQLQVRLAGRDGVEFFADMWWPEVGLVGECDGRLKYEGAGASPDALWREKLRQEWMETHGVGVMRWNWREADLAPKALANRWRALAARRAGWRPPGGLTIGRPHLAA